GIDRIAARVRDVVQTAVRRSGAVVEDDHGVTVLWPAGAAPDAFDGFRPPVTEADAREIDELSTRELANAARVLLVAFGAMERADLVREVARLFGFARTSARIEERVGLAVDRLVSGGGATLDGAMVRP
ncbi:MAG: hypothetical protein KDB80_10960, partial [Planctomycetes bacterium]|nr:hypothetical protein [Planctomycetota bacterium]